MISNTLLMRDPKSKPPTAKTYSPTKEITAILTVWPTDEIRTDTLIREVQDRAACYRLPVPQAQYVAAVIGEMGRKKTISIRRDDPKLARKRGTVPHRYVSRLDPKPSRKRKQNGASTESAKPVESHPDAIVGIPEIGV